VFLATKGTPFKTMKDIVAYAKANPGKLKIATLSPGTTQSLGVELFKVAAGVDVVPIPFRSSTDAANAVMRGDVDLDLDSYAVLRGLIDDGKIVAIATSGKTRAFYLKEVPTAIESGVPGFDVASWNGIAAPAGVPRPIVDKLNAAINASLQTAEVQASVARLGMVPKIGSPQQFAGQIAAEFARWTAVAKAADIRVD
jgi:tripartite-type tricarboxylate transporter receptor subunit TctC